MNMFTKKYKIVHAMMVAFVAISMFAFSSCELESSDNGKLDGFGIRRVLILLRMARRLICLSCMSSGELSIN